MESSAKGRVTNEARRKVLSMNTGNPPKSFQYMMPARQAMINGLETSALAVKLKRWGNGTFFSEYHDNVLTARTLMMGIINQ